MPPAKIQLRVQFAIVRNGDEPLSCQIVRQLQQAIDEGSLPGGAPVPSSRSLARLLRVSRNTVLTAYDELAARGLLRSHRGAGVYVNARSIVSGFDIRSLVRRAQYPSRTLALSDPDGNPIAVLY